MLRTKVRSRLTSQQLKGLVSKSPHTDPDMLVGFVEAAQLEPRIDSIYAHEDTPGAMTRLVAGEALGKIAILVIADSGICSGCDDDDLIARHRRFRPCR